MNVQQSLTSTDKEVWLESLAANQLTTRGSTELHFENHRFPTM